MKLVDLLKEGKKATREGLDFDYIYTSDINGTFGFQDNEPVGVYNIGLSDLTREDWEEYKEVGYKTGFKFEVGEKYYMLSKFGLRKECFTDSYAENITIDNFKAFPNKELAEYINDRQLLERKLMIFSYLNGANEINWEDCSTKYSIDYYICQLSEDDSYISSNESVKEGYRTYFKSKEIAEKAFEIYKDEIKSIMKRSLKFGF